MLHQDHLQNYMKLKNGFIDIIHSPRLKYYDKIVVNNPPTGNKDVHPGTQLYIDIQKLNEHSLLIDCHPLLSDADVDVCINVHRDCSRPSVFVIGLTREAFKQQGLKVRVDDTSPHSSASDPNLKFHKLDIGLKNSVYAESLTQDALEDAYNIVKALKRLYTLLRSHAELV